MLLVVLRRDSDVRKEASTVRIFESVSCEEFLNLENHKMNEHQYLNLEKFISIYIYICHHPSVVSQIFVNII